MPITQRLNTSVPVKSLEAGPGTGANRLWFPFQVFFVFVFFFSPWLQVKQVSAFKSINKFLFVSLKKCTEQSKGAPWLSLSDLSTASGEPCELRGLGLSL